MSPNEPRRQKPVPVTTRTEAFWIAVFGIMAFILGISLVVGFFHELLFG